MECQLRLRQWNWWAMKGELSDLGTEMGKG